VTDQLITIGTKSSGTVLNSAYVKFHSIRKSDYRHEFDNAIAYRWEADFFGVELEVSDDNLKKLEELYDEINVWRKFRNQHGQIFYFGYIPEDEMNKHFDFGIICVEVEKFDLTEISITPSDYGGITFAPTIIPIQTNYSETEALIDAIKESVRDEEDS